MIRLIKPKYFMPIHGEYRMLKEHADLGVMCDIPKENTFVLSNGDVLNMKNRHITKGETITAGDSYVDGNKIGDVDNIVIKERKSMSQDGIVIITLAIKNNKLLSNPTVTTRGFVLVNDNMELLHDLENKTKLVVENKLKNINELKSLIISELVSYIFDKTDVNRQYYQLLWR